MGASIADILSNKEKSHLVLPNINKGDVFKMRLTPKEGIIPKNKGDNDRDKYFIIVGKTANNALIGFVVINSYINTNISKELQDLHYPINVSDYPFLKKNSFVCCAELKEITADNFIDRYEGERRCGKLTNEDLELIIGALKSSPLVTPKQLKRFGL